MTTDILDSRLKHKPTDRRFKNIRTTAAGKRSPGAVLLSRHNVNVKRFNEINEGNRIGTRQRFKKGGRVGREVVSCSVRYCCCCVVVVVVVVVVGRSADRWLYLPFRPAGMSTCSNSSRRTVTLRYQ
ncbi:hypothetical protein chiPu_0009242 [Chiloscyllium punctatum]|uniref:Uncharacterized protein n=1 Tax=Chiloscyllium punctatum TaxID=137246 RepID=A0A401SK73_CHIPU|nr:hypothetical protein [Chiloscyllium punctatum]